MNITEIAKLANVSVSTVSKVMNNRDDSISTATRAKVLKLAKEHNYTPYSSLVASMKKSFTISVILQDTGHYFPMLNGILDAATAKGYSVILTKVSGEEEEEKALSLSRTSGSSAVLLEHTGEISPKLRASLQKSDVPVRFFSPFSHGTSGIGIRSLAERMTDLLAERGHRDILCMTSDKSDAERSFFSGYAESLMKHGIPYRSYRSIEITPELLRKFATKSMSAIICPNYKASLSVYDFLTKQNFRIPENISLLSLYCGNEAHNLGNHISTLRIPFYEFGEFTCLKFIDSLEKNERKFEEKKFSLPEIELSHYASIDRPFSESDKKILVVGSLNIDTYLQFDTLPEPNALMKTEASSISPGGTGLNMATASAKLGHSTELLGAIGNDASSFILFDSLREHHIEHKNLIRFSDAQTGKSYHFRDKKGDSLISVFSGANDRFGSDLLKQAESSFSNVGYCLISTDIPHKTVHEACLLARRYGAKTIVKLSSPESPAPDILKEADIVVSSSAELQRMFPELEDTEEMLDRLLACGVGEVILTLDSGGCIYKTKTSEKSFAISSFPLVDTSGASEAFISTLASCLLSGYDMETSIRAANYAASQVTSKEGIIPALIDRRHLDDFLSALNA